MAISEAPCFCDVGLSFRRRPRRRARASGSTGAERAAAPDRAGVGTPLSQIESVLEAAGLVHITSVNPGFSGQSFVESRGVKIKDLMAMCMAKGVDPWIEIDGGVRPANAYKVIDR